MTTKQIINLKKVTVDMNNAYMFNSYPGPGAYLVNGTDIAIVYGGTVFYCMGAAALAEETDDLQNHATGMPFNLAEVLAVALHREAAVAMMEKK